MKEAFQVLDLLRSVKTAPELTALFDRLFPALQDLKFMPANTPEELSFNRSIRTEIGMLKQPPLGGINVEQVKTRIPTIFKAALSLRQAA